MYSLTQCLLPVMFYKNCCVIPQLGSWRDGSAANVLAALTEGPSLVPSINMVAHNFL